MNDQKLENLLNLALDSTESERIRSKNLNIGYDAAEDLWTVIIKYTGNVENIRQIAEEVTELFGGFAVLKISRQALPLLTQIPQVTYVEKPKALYFALESAKRESCLTAVQRENGGLTGKGVIFACIDSGVSIVHPDFRKEDGTTRILFLWDQTIPGNPPEGYHQGTEYTQEQINEALLAAAPEERKKLVPSEDISGHGTGVLGIGAGNGRGSAGQFRGVAYEADLIVVKLGSPGTTGFPRTTELMEGVDYCIRKAAAFGRPIAVNISFGNNYGAHNGSSLLEAYLDAVSGVGKNVICVGMGNEGTAGVHQAITLQQGKTFTVEVAIGEYQSSTNLQLWKSYADRIRIFVESPSGVRAGPLEEVIGTQRFRLQNTELLIYYGMPTPYGVLQEIYIDFLPSDPYLPSGIWKIHLEPVNIVWNLADMWLPVSETANSRTRFLTPSVGGSFTVPAAAANVISVAAYNSLTDSYADFSGRAFNVLPWAGKPDLAAPGVDLRTAAVGGGYRTVSGTSFATPFVTGSAALLMEWGIVQGNDPFLFGNKVKAYLRRGARKLPGFSQIPNFRVGYGALCVRESLPF